MKRLGFVTVLTHLALIAILTVDAHATYHPGMGRFLQRDPVEYKDGMSLYEYVRSNPIRGMDPMGLQMITITTLPIEETNPGRDTLLDKAIDAIVGPFKQAKQVHQDTARRVNEATPGPVLKAQEKLHKLMETPEFQSFMMLWGPGEARIVTAEEVTARIVTEELAVGRMTAAEIKAAEAAGDAAGCASYPSGQVPGGVVAGDVTATYESGVVSQYTGPGAQAALRASSSSGVISAETLVKVPHGNSLLSLRTCYLYRLETQSGDFLKWGISQNLATKRSHLSFLKCFGGCDDGSP